MKKKLIVIGALIVVLAPLEGVFIGRYFNLVNGENIAVLFSVLFQMIIGVFLVISNIKWPGL